MNGNLCLSGGISSVIWRNWGQCMVASGSNPDDSWSNWEDTQGGIGTQWALSGAMIQGGMDTQPGDSPETQRHGYPARSPGDGPGKHIYPAGRYRYPAG